MHGNSCVFQEASSGLIAVTYYKRRWEPLQRLSLREGGDGIEGVGFM